MSKVGHQTQFQRYFEILASENNSLREKRKQATREIFAEIVSSEPQLNLSKIILDPETSLLSVCGTRRSTKTTTIGLVTLAILINNDNYTVRLISSTLRAPTDNWLDRPGETRFSFLGQLANHGFLDITKVLWSADGIKHVQFPWGSSLSVHSLDNMRAINRKRGFTANLYWFDESQDLLTLSDIWKKLIAPTLADNQGAKVVLSGTPGSETGSFFHKSISNDNWNSYFLRLWDNPAYGDTPEERWNYFFDKVVKPNQYDYGLNDSELEKLKSLDTETRNRIGLDDEPESLKEFIDSLDKDLLREIFGKWVSDGADQVFAWNRVSDFYYCSIKENNKYGLPVATTLEERINCLPRLYNGESHHWESVIGLDIGWNDPTAWTVLIQSDTYPQSFCIWTEKIQYLEDDKIWDRTIEIIQELEDLGIKTINVRPDLTGPRLGSSKTLDSRLRARLPNSIAVILPKKQDKISRIRSLNMDLRVPRIRFIHADDLDIEGKNLRFKANVVHSTGLSIHETRKVTLESGETVVPGDHLLDALLYASQSIFTIGNKEPPKKIKLSPAEQAEARNRDRLKKFI